MDAADLELVVDLVDLIATRPRFLCSMAEGRRSDEARFHMAGLLDLAARAAGDETLLAAYGAPPADRGAALSVFAERADLASLAFGKFDRGPGSLNEAAAEARAIAQGDKPERFEKLGRRRAIVLLRAKFEALRWEAWLSGFGVSTADRHAAISHSFGAVWDTISRWKQDVEAAWGSEASRQMEADERDAAKGLRMWSMRPNEPWQAGLRRAGERYIRALRER